jgi:hypothetical protein
MYPLKAQSSERARSENVLLARLFHVDSGPRQYERFPGQLEVSATHFCSLHRVNLCRSRDNDYDLRANSIPSTTNPTNVRLLIAGDASEHWLGDGEKCCESWNGDKSSA